MRVVRCTVAVVLLALLLGAQWTLLQAVAWTRMLVTYSHDHSWSEAVQMTFDGRHPCDLCHFIRAARSLEHPQTLVALSTELRQIIECDLPPVAVELQPPGRFHPHPILASSAPSRAQAPPKPRPRSVHPA